MNRLICITLTLLSLFSCKKEEKVCPANYTGANCDQEVAPGRVRITRIQITNFKATNDGAQWDVNSLWPDPYFEILDLNGTIFTSSYLSEKQPGEISQWDVDVVVLPSNNYVIVFYDEDGNTDTLIDSAVLQYYVKGQGFPERYTFDAIDGSQISVWVKYEY